MNFILSNLTRLLDTSDTSTGAGGSGNIWMTLLSFSPLLILAVVMYFFMIRPQKKQQKEADQMRNGISRGDIITTIGGVVGVVIVAKDDDIIIESSGDKTKVQIKKWAVKSVDQKADEA